jgi:hypothetical protein
MTIKRTGLAAGLPPEASTLEAEILTALMRFNRDFDATGSDAKVARLRGRQLVASTLNALCESDFIKGGAVDDDAVTAGMFAMFAITCRDFVSEIDADAHVGKESAQTVSLLEAEIADALAKVPSDADLVDLYTDAGDRARVRRRGLISATLDATFRHGHKKFPIDTDGSINITSQPDVFFELAYARLDFLHDQRLLDLGGAAELVLRPVGRETVSKQQTIKAKRKVLIYWLAVIELWDERRDVGFKSQEELMVFSARQTGRERGAIKTARSDFEGGRKCSQAELVLYHDLIDRARTLSVRGDGASTPFELLLPVVVGIARAAYRQSFSSIAES